MHKQQLKRIRRIRSGRNFEDNGLQDLLIEVAIMKKLDHENSKNCN